MIQGAIDIGSNTVRMLLAECRRGRLNEPRYFRRITRLAGGMGPDGRLQLVNCQRTQSALQDFVALARAQGVEQLRAVGTAALRGAYNRAEFIAAVNQETGLEISIISGNEEARLATRGVLSVVEPVPEQAVILDIGGGSTELIAWQHGRIDFQLSLELGVVGLAEQCPDRASRLEQIHARLAPFASEFAAWHEQALPLQLIGTAGTITSLAAMHLQLKDYDPDQVNNHCLDNSWLGQVYAQLQSLSVAEREELPGLEAGRGDLMLPGLDILLAVMEMLGLNEVKVADAGLLEGTLLEHCPAD